LNPHLLLRRSDGGRRAHPFKYLERLEPKTSRRWQEHRRVGTPSSENSPVSGKNTTVSGHGQSAVIAAITFVTKSNSPVEESTCGWWTE
jgi:hypothetical protein